MKKIGLIAGSFDLIHPGYIHMFREAKRECDHLVVALHKDPSLERPEKLKPVLDYWDRFNTLSAIKYVDQIVPYEIESDLVELLERIKPDVRFLGDDYMGKPITGKDLNIHIYYLDRSHGWSTTKLKKMVYDSLSDI